MRVQTSCVTSAVAEMLLKVGADRMVDGLWNQVWEALTAIGTISMAVTTVAVILQSRRARQDSDQHHQNGFRPICVLTPYAGVDPRHRRDTLLTIVDPKDPAFGTVELKCELRNIGPGPALNLRIMFRFLDMGGYTTDPWELSPLSALECRGSDANPLRVPIQYRDRFNIADFVQVPGKAWELILEYQDIFGNTFHSIHAKRPLQLDRLYKEADTAEIVAPPQPWVTIREGEFVRLLNSNGQAG